NREAGSIVHGNVFDSGQRPWPGESDITHVADVKNAYTGAYGQVLGDNAGVLNRHIPAVELDHFCAQLAMNGVQRSLSHRGCGFDRRQKTSIISGGWAADGKPIKLTCGWEVFNRLYSYCTRCTMFGTGQRTRLVSRPETSRLCPVSRYSTNRTFPLYALR